MVIELILALIAQFFKLWMKVAIFSTPSGLRPRNYIQQLWVGYLSIMMSSNLDQTSCTDVLSSKLFAFHPSCQIPSNRQNVPARVSFIEYPFG